MIAPAPQVDLGSQVNLGLCNSGYCDSPAVAYVSRRRGPSGRVLIILGARAQQIGANEPLALRCLDCAHHELDIALGAEGKRR